jgi:hypothetical protein
VWPTPIRHEDPGGPRRYALDARSIAIVAVRTSRLRGLTPDGELEALRMLTDDGDELAHRRAAGAGCPDRESAQWWSVLMRTGRGWSVTGR